MRWPSPWTIHWIRQARTTRSTVTRAMQRRVASRSARDTPLPAEHAAIDLEQPPQDRVPAVMLLRIPPPLAPEGGQILSQKLDRLIGQVGRVAGSVEQAGVREAHRLGHPTAVHRQHREAAG